MSNSKVKASAKEQEIPAGLAGFDQLPDGAFVRMPVVRAVNGNVGPATVWRWCKAGILPAPHKIGPNTTAWNVGELRRMRTPNAKTG
jgi:prophage regulatory protein